MLFLTLSSKGMNTIWHFINLKTTITLKAAAFHSFDLHHRILWVDKKDCDRHAHVWPYCLSSWKRTPNFTQFDFTMVAAIATEKQLKEAKRIRKAKEDRKKNWQSFSSPSKAKPIPIGTSTFCQLRQVCDAAFERPSGDPLRLQLEILTPSSSDSFEWVHLI